MLIRISRRTSGSSLAALVSLAGLIALAGCGSSGTHACPAVGCCAGSSDACVVPQALSANGLNGQIAVFPIQGGTGLPGSPTFTTGPGMSLGMAAFNNQFLYVSNPQLTLTGASMIDAWSIDLGTGALTTIAGSPFSLEPLSLAGGLAVNNTSQVLYVADAGKIDALKADATGALSPVAGSPFPAGSNLYLTVDPLNRFVFASDDTLPGNVLAFTIDSSTGALTTVPGSPFATNPSYVGNSQPGAIVVDSTGSFVYTVLAATNQVAAFSILASSGALNPIPGSPFSAGKDPIALVEVNNFLYISNAMDGTVSGYSIDATTGVLTPLVGSPFAIPGGPLATPPYGAYLYTTGPGGLLTFSVNPQTGALTPVGSPIPYAGATVLTFLL
jgi:6-phosphogluconolactonase